MEHTPRLDETLVHVFSPQRNWLDHRHLQTLAWMIVGLVHSRWIARTAWTPSVPSRAVDAQRRVRHIERWRHHTRLAVPQLSGPLRQPA